MLRHEYRQGVPGNSLTASFRDDLDDFLCVRLLDREVIECDVGTFAGKCDRRGAPNS